MGVYEGGIVTRTRLACARAIQIVLWKLTVGNVRLFLCEHHPFRVYIEGVNKSNAPMFVDSLRRAAGPRTSLATRWRLLALALVVANTALLLVEGETKALRAIADSAVTLF